MMILLNYTINLRDGTPLNIRGGQVEESGDIRLRLDKISKAALSEVCGFPVNRAFMISEDGMECSLYAERRGAEKITSFADLDEYSRVLLFENEMEAFGLYMMAKLATPRE